MKHLCIYLFGIISLTNSFGGVGTLTGGSRNGKITQSDSWDKILKTVRNEQGLKIKGDYAYVGQIVSLFDVCTDGRNFTTTKKLPVYKNVRVRLSNDQDGDRDGYTNVITDYKHRTYPLNAIQTERQCDNNDKRCRNVEKEFNQETEKEISVYQFIKTQGTDKKEIYKKLFKKKYYVPNCD